MKIAHIADVHIRLYKRHEEYKEVFEKLYKSLRNEKVDRIILDGDIFHSKSILSPEALETGAGFFKELADIAPVEVVIGNHDVNLKNNDRLNSLSPIVELVKKMQLDGFERPLTVHEKSTIFCVENSTERVFFGIFSILDETNFPIICSPIIPNDSKTLTKIALFHGCVVGSSTESGYTFKDGSYNASIMFKNYDAVMLGDIHKRQKIGSKAWYSGSLIQQDFAEFPDKGYLLWDTSKTPLEPEYIQIPNDYAFHNIKVGNSFGKVSKDNIPAISNPAKKSSIRLTLSDFDYNVAELKAIEVELMAIYNPISLEVKREVTPTKISSTIQKIKSTADVQQQNSLIKSFLKDIEPIQINRILKINEMVRGSIQDDEILQPNLWKIKEMSWDNTFSYGTENVINFDNLKGLIGIFAPNRSGKSNFIDTMLYNLFNKSARMSKITKIINNKSEECKSSMTIDVNGELYKIIRSSKRSGDGASTKVIFNKSENGNWISACGDSRTDTDKIIRKLIGSFDDVVVSNISPQGKISYFLESGMEDTFRLELLSRFLGLNIFKLQYDFAKTQLSEYTVLLKQFKAIDYATLVKNYHDELEKVIESLEDFEEDKIFFGHQVDIVKVQVATLKAMVQDIEDDTKIAEVDQEKLFALQINLKVQIDSENKLKQEEVERIQKLSNIDFVSKIEIAKNNLKQKIKLQDEIRKTEADIRVAQAGLKKDKSRVEILKKQTWTDENESCKICDFYKEADSLRKELQKLEQDIQDLMKIKGGLDLEYSSIMNADTELENIKAQETELKNLQSSVKYRQVNIEKFELQIDKIKTIIAEQNKEAQKIESIKQIKESNNQINGMVFDKESELKKIQNQVNSIEYSIVTHNKRTAELESMIFTTEQTIVKMNETEIQHADYTLYLQCMHREGLPYSIISSSIDIINDEIQKIVGDYIPFAIRFGMDNDKKNIPINIIYEDGTINPIELGSGMEKTISAIAIRAALASISNIPKCNLFVIDESFGALDKEWIASIDKFLVHLKSMFEHVILISHVTEIQDYVDQTITIDTSNGYSSLQYN